MQEDCLQNYKNLTTPKGFFRKNGENQIISNFTNLRA